MLDLFITYWVEIILTSIVTFVVYMFKQYNGLKNGMHSLLRNEIVRIYEIYIPLKYCPSYMKENLNEIYNNYHKLGGNGMATAMVEEIYKLPNEIRGVRNERQVDISINKFIKS